MRLVQQDRVFGPRADHLRLDAARGERLARAVDDPGAGGVHVLDLRKIDRRRRARRRRSVNSASARFSSCAPASIVQPPASAKRTPSAVFSLVMAGAVDIGRSNSGASKGRAAQGARLAIHRAHDKAASDRLSSRRFARLSGIAGRAGPVEASASRPGSGRQILPPP